MKIIFIFLLGLGILVGAIFLNFVASRIGLLSWFEFLKNPAKATVPSYVWLFVIYPLLLGILAFLISKLLRL